MSAPRQFQQFPTSAPTTPLLDGVELPADLRKLAEEQLPELADELREEMLYLVSQTGGHFGAGLGVVELTVALHYLLDTPHDKLVWDVGHQSYPHKILTGRRSEMKNVRRAQGPAGFPKRGESEYDTFGTGHSSTSISAALGMALDAKRRGAPQKTVAVIGDGAMTAGMAFEALTHAAETGANLLVVLNDNQMSISKNSGGLANYFARIWASKPYISFRENSKKVLSKIPNASAIAARTEEHMKGMVSPGTMFEELGFNYVGLLDGHDLDEMLPALRNLLELPGPQLLHITTVKGKGFVPAEEDPVGYHAINKIDPVPAQEVTELEIAPPTPSGKKYQTIFGDWLCDLAVKDESMVAITPAMCEGSGMVEFAGQFPERFFDVAIAEQHAVTLAAGLATGDTKPVVAIYSTFLQRAYDQLIHDVALQNLDVTFGIDRAGLVGEDGPTHAGAYDLSYLRCVPNMIVMAPSNEAETRLLLQTGYEFKGPAAIRYPRGTGSGVEVSTQLESVEIGKGVLRKRGQQVAILAFGTLYNPAHEVAEELDFSIADMRFVKPLDEALIKDLAESHELIVTIEENAVMGGAGSAVVEYLNQSAIQKPVLQLGLPDAYIDHGKHADLLSECGLDRKGIRQSILKRLELLGLASRDAAYDSVYPGKYSQTAQKKTVSVVAEAKPDRQSAIEKQALASVTE